MKISEHLILELLELTRMYTTIPFNSIFQFVAFDDKKTIDFFDGNIYHPMTKGRTDYGWKVVSILTEIRSELQHTSKD